MNEQQEADSTRYLAFFVYIVGYKQTGSGLSFLTGSWPADLVAVVIQQVITSVSETIRKPPLVEAQNAVGKNTARNDFRYGGRSPS